MKTDSMTTRHQKSTIQERIEIAFDIKLPSWYYSGATVEQLRTLQRLFEAAHERYSEEDVPLREDNVCPTCGRVHTANDIAGFPTVNLVPLIPGHEYIIKYQSTQAHYVREARMGFMGRPYQSTPMLEFSGRGPDRTHGGKERKGEGPYAGTVTLDLRIITSAQEVERDDAKRYVGRRADQ